MTIKKLLKKKKSKAKKSSYQRYIQELLKVSDIRVVNR